MIIKNDRKQNKIDACVRFLKDQGNGHTITHEEIKEQMKWKSDDPVEWYYQIINKARKILLDDGIVLGTDHGKGYFIADNNGKINVLKGKNQKIKKTANVGKKILVAIPLEELSIEQQQRAIEEGVKVQLPLLFSKNRKLLKAIAETTSPQIPVGKEMLQMILVGMKKEQKQIAS